MYSSKVISIAFSGHICSALLGCSNIFCLQSPQHCGNNLHWMHAGLLYVLMVALLSNLSCFHSMFPSEVS